MSKLSKSGAERLREYLNSYEAEKNYENYLEISVTLWKCREEIADLLDAIERTQSYYMELHKTLHGQAAIPTEFGAITLAKAALDKKLNGEG